MPNPRIVSDTSPLLYLGRIGQLELLPQLFSEVYVPEQVALELDAGRLIRGDTPDPRQIPWVKLVSVTADMLTALPANTLGLGERATIAYALARGNFVAALDDRRARLLAQQLKAPVVGVAGILLKAKKAGILPSVKPYLDAAKSQGFYLHSDTHAQVLSLAGEVEDKQ
jgi:predicted nucleic acid-binding protein